MKRSFLHSTVLIVLLVSARFGFATERMEKLPAELSQVKLTEKQGEKVATDIIFRDETGKRVRLADLFHDQMPILLSFNYSNCPMLCSLQLDGLVDTMKEMEWTLGEQYEIITISLDPNETTQRAGETKKRYLDKYQRNGTSKGWHFLTGTAEDIKTVADSVGFGYFYHPSRKEYLHPAVLTLISPRAVISGYLPGVQFDDEDLRDKLVMASLGDVSLELVEFILSCYHYDATTRNGAIVSKIMTYSGLVFIIGFALALAILRTKRAQNVDEYQSGSTGEHV